MSSALAGRCLTTGPQGSPGFVSLHRTVVKKQSYGQWHLLNKQSNCVRQSILLAQVSPGLSRRHHAGSSQSRFWDSPEMWKKREWVITCDPVFTWQKAKWQTALLRMKRGGEGGGVGIDNMSLGLFPPPFLAPGLSLVTLYSHPPAAVALYCPLAVVKFLTVFTIILSKKIHHDYGNLTSQSKN